VNESIENQSFHCPSSSNYSPAIVHDFSLPEIVSGAAAVSDHIQSVQVSFVPAQMRCRR
jgi:hypothetical protein